MSRFDHDEWFARHRDVKNVQVGICDLNGVMRGKRVPVESLAKVFSGGLRMPLSLSNVDIWGSDISQSALVFESGDADGMCVHTGWGILPVDWTGEPSALVPLWMHREDGTPFGGDPRQALQSVVERFGARGLTPVVATELEFYLLDPSGSVPQAPVSPLSGRRLAGDGIMSLDDLEQFEGFLNDVYRACAAQGIPAETAVSENGAGQFEINMAHVDDALRAADDAFFFKKLVRGMARKHGFGATFMARPYSGRAGNGFHVHFSLLDENRNNIFDDGSQAGSPMLRHAVAGMLASMEQLMLTFAPHFNSYRRLTPGSHAPTGIGWGYENRTGAIRIPGGSPKARRIEHRVAGADANPYLVLASVLGGALHGIENALEPPAPIVGDAYSQDLEQLPGNWGAAIRALGDGELAAQIYSQEFVELFVGCKRQELGRFDREVTDFELSSYLETV